jgi:lipopolysaccharide assembly protein A
MRKVLSIIFVLILMFVALAFTTLNLGVVALNFYFISVTLPIAVAVFGLMLIGAVLGGVVSSLLWMSKTTELRRLRRKLAEREKELDSLRNLPLKDST